MDAVERLGAILNNLTSRSLLALSLSFPLFGVAHAVDFNYESEPIASYQTSFSETISGLTCTAKSSGGWLHITNHDVPTAMGTKYIIANDNSFNNPPTSPFSPLDFSFSQVVQHATLLAGDTGGDNDGFVTVDLYDVHNTFLQRYSSFLGTSALAVSIDITTPFSRAVVDTTNTSFNPHSIGAEWHNVAATPEPATLAALGVPLLAFFRRRRRQTA